MHVVAVSASATLGCCQLLEAIIRLYGNLITSCPVGPRSVLPLTLPFASDTHPANISDSIGDYSGPDKMVVNQSLAAVTGDPSMARKTARTCCSAHSQTHTFTAQQEAEVSLNPPQSVRAAGWCALDLRATRSSCSVTEPITAQEPACRFRNQVCLCSTSF